MMNVRVDNRFLIVGADVVLLTFCVWAALLAQPQTMAVPEVWVYLAAPLIALPIFIRFGLYRAFLRYISTRAFLAIAQAVTLHALLLAIAISLIGNELPLAFALNYWLLALVVIGGSRIALRSALRWIARGRQNCVRVAIFGAGSAGAQLAEILQSDPRYLPVAFLDDKRTLQGNEIRDLKIYPRAKLKELIQRFGVTHVLLALPAASTLRRREIMQFLEEHPVHVKTIPSLPELLLGKSDVGEIRELDPTDILERDPIPPDENLLRQCISGKAVAITGAGGSIGSELSRQIVLLRPRLLVLFEHCEYALYKIERELREMVSDMANPPLIKAVLGTVIDEQQLTTLFRREAVETVYHAAAYKHVPLVEENPVPGVVNNVFGTWFCARAALAANVRTFTLVSTDKAVRPTNVMGAAKRVAEQAVQGLAENSTRTRFSIVRFGNVLDSSGSVVPLFRKQIRKGGPVTITHPEITRYFMTIPEAAQLVVQASAMGGRGDVFVLDMGEPVRVAALARRMIMLSGLTVKDDAHPDGDIEIVVTTLRPGEKLYEELVIGGEVMPTAHSRIMRVREKHLALGRLEQLLDEMRAACEQFDVADVHRSLRHAVPEYTPDKECQPHREFTPAGRTGSAASPVTARELG